MNWVDEVSWVPQRDSKANASSRLTRGLRHQFLNNKQKIGKSYEHVMTELHSGQSLHSLPKRKRNLLIKLRQGNP